MSQPGMSQPEPPRSALNLRLLLASFGLLVCAAGAVLMFATGATALGVVLVALAVVAAVDIVIVVRRRRRRGGRHGEYSIFE